MMLRGKRMSYIIQVYYVFRSRLTGLTRTTSRSATSVIAGKKICVIVPLPNSISRIQMPSSLVFRPSIVFFAALIGSLKSKLTRTSKLIQHMAKPNKAQLPLKRTSSKRGLGLISGSNFLCPDLVEGLLLMAMLYEQSSGSLLFFLG